MDDDEYGQRQKLAKLDEAQAALQQELAALKREKRAAKQRMNHRTKSENWHRQRLSYGDRIAGFSGEMAEARYYLRSMSFTDYMTTISIETHDTDSESISGLELIAIKRNFESWTTKGQALLLDRSRSAYLEKCESFARWQADNPGKTNWRNGKMTREQKFLILRICEARDCPVPSKMSRGEAHEWIAAMGGNPRLARNAND